MRVIGVRIDGEASCRPVFEPLVNRQDHHLSGAAKLALHQDAGQVGFHAGAVGAVIVQNGFDLAGEFHGMASAVCCSYNILFQYGAGPVSSRNHHARSSPSGSTHPDIVAGFMFRHMKKRAARNGPEAGA